jgi:hypothetical protein
MRCDHKDKVFSMLEKIIAITGAIKTKMMEIQITFI